MMIYFDDCIDVAVDSYEAAVRQIESITAQPRERWEVEAPNFNDGTTRWLAVYREYDDEPDIKTYFEVYENPSDSYMYYVATYRKGPRIVKQTIVKYGWAGQSGPDV